MIKGRINPPPPQGFDYGSIQPDFSGDVSPHQVKAKGESNGEFKLEIKEYDFSEDYRSRITDEPLTFPEIKVTLDVCTPNGCGKSNTEIVQEEDSGAYITMGSNKGIKIASLGDNSEDFSTKQVGGNNGQSAAEVFARTYYKATGKLNEPMVLYGGGIYFPKELLKMNAIPRVRLKVWRNGFDYFSSKAYSFIPGTPYRFERTWDGKHNGKLVPEGEYKLRQTIHLANGQERQIAVQKIYIVHKHPGKIRLYALSHISFPYFGNFPLGTPLGGVNMTVHAPDGDPGVTVTTGAILGIADVGIFKKGKHVISVGNAYGSKSVLETVESVNEEPELVAHFAQNQLFRLIRKN